MVGDNCIGIRADRRFLTVDSIDIIVQFVSEFPWKMETAGTVAVDIVSCEIPLDISTCLLGLVRCLWIVIALIRLIFNSSEQRLVLVNMPPDDSRCIRTDSSFVLSENRHNPVERFYQLTGCVDTLSLTDFLPGEKLLQITFL